MTIAVAKSRRTLFDRPMPRGLVLVGGRIVHSTASGESIGAALAALIVADLIVADWLAMDDPPEVSVALLTEAARAIVHQIPTRVIGETGPAVVALDVLEHRARRERAVYGWPFVDAETIDAMAVRAARVWRDREGE